MANTKITYGEPQVMQSTVAVLDWTVRRVDSDQRAYVDAAKLFTGIEGNGVYAFQGCQDAHPGRTVLYVGQANRNCPTPLGDEMRQSFGRFQEGGRLYSDVSDLTVHWARIAPGFEKYICDIEQLLIAAHAPPFNKQHARGWYKGQRELVLVNVGSKGRLLPSVVGMYHSAEGWPD